MKLRRIKLTKYERELEEALLKGELVPGSKAEFDEIAQMLARRKKDAVLNIRINQGDLDDLKAKAKRHGVKYQTFIAEVLHRVAHS
jgi:predicted DNA binding CopG/RHH family protein